MITAFARIRRDACLLLRMATRESGTPNRLSVFERDDAADEADAPQEHPHGDTCACQLRGE